MKRHFLVAIISLIFQCKDIYSQAFTDSNLPIVVINTNGQDIDGAWLDMIVDMGVIDNGPGNRNHLTDAFNNFNGKIEIRLQGSSTTQLPKKSYRVTTLDNSLNKVDVGLMGLPPEEDWVFKALYQDKSFLRDAVAFRISNQMGHYASKIRFFELVVNGDYRGVYELEEKVKRDKYRVDISKLSETDLAGDEITGGYIISLDNFLPGEKGWYSKYQSSPNKDSANYFLFAYPKPDSIHPLQMQYIKGYFDAFEDALVGPNSKDPVNGYRKYIDVPSFADNFIITELSRNVDGYRRSTFFYKDRESTGNGKLHAGPVWDFNIAFGNASYNYGDNPHGWAFPQPTNMNFVPFWWNMFFNDTTFTSELRCRWGQWRSTILDANKINAYIDSMAAVLNESQQRNFTRWPIMGQVVYPNPQPVPQTYTEEVGKLKWWVQERISWMDWNMPGICFVGINEPSLAKGEAVTYPNPFNDEFRIAYKIPEKSRVKVELTNALGEETQTIYCGDRNPGLYQETVQCGTLAEGAYFLKLTINEQVYFRKLIKVAD
jgi:hypothetical protein